jgi:hypothetical protein
MKRPEICRSEACPRDPAGYGGRGECCQAGEMARSNEGLWQAPSLRLPGHSSCPPVGSSIIFVKMALDIWKSRLYWTSSISSSLVGNDFQQPRGNQAFRHFHMSTISTPYGGPAYAERRRPAQAVGAETTAAISCHRLRFG